MGLGDLSGEAAPMAISSISCVPTFVDENIYKGLKLPQNLFDRLREQDLLRNITIMGWSTVFIPNDGPSAFPSYHVRTADMKGIALFGAVTTADCPSLKPFSNIRAAIPDAIDGNTGKIRNSRVPFTVAHFKHATTESLMNSNIGNLKILLQQFKAHPVAAKEYTKQLREKKLKNELALSQNFVIGLGNLLLDVLSSFEDNLEEARRRGVPIDLLNSSVIVNTILEEERKHQDEKYAHTVDGSQTSFHTMVEAQAGLTHMYEVIGKTLTVDDRHAEVIGENKEIAVFYHKRG
jgi:hypothetical protein